jgi:hypothetical protein
MTTAEIIEWCGYVALAWLSGVATGVLHRAIERFFKTAAE